MAEQKERIKSETLEEKDWKLQVLLSGYDSDQDLVSRAFRRGLRPNKDRE
jgi:hypothetical protein